MYLRSTDSFGKWITPKGEEQSHLQTSQLYVAVGSFESTGVLMRPVAGWQ